MRIYRVFGFILSFVLLVSAAFSPMATAADASAGLHYAFQPGQTYAYDLTIQVNYPDATETVTGLSKYEVKSVDSAPGQITMTHSVDLSRSIHVNNQGNRPFAGAAALRYSAGSPFAFANYNSPCQIVIDPKGKIIRYDRKSQLPYLLGNLWAVTLEPLPSAGQKQWQSKQDMEIVDEENSAWMPRPFLNKTTSRTATETIDYTIDSSNVDAPVITRTYSLATEEQNNGDPVISQKGNGTITFDAKAGMIRSVDEKYTLQLNNPNVTVKIPITITARLLTAAEAAKKIADRKAATQRVQQAVQSGPKLQTIDNTELDRLLKRINSSDPAFRRSALGELKDSAPIEQRRDEVSKLLVGLLNDGDDFVVREAARALQTWGNSDCIAPLMKLLDDHNEFTRQAAIEAMAGFKSESVAEALAKQMTDEQVRMQASKSLKAMGDLAEKPVLPLLKNPNWVVRSQACEILAVVGTSQSIDALKDAAIDDNGLVRMKAKDAIKAIQARGNNPATQSAQ